jgi:hypothetical protein
MRKKMASSTQKILEESNSFSGSYEESYPNDSAKQEENTMK